MRAVLDQHLTVYDPGPLRPYLRRWATYRRIGRLKGDAARILPFYTDFGDHIVVPRALIGPARRLVPTLAVEDRRLHFPRRDFRWRGQLYPYQEAPVTRLFRRQGGILVASPGAGKTIMGLALVARWGQPALWLADTLDLKDQALAQARTLFDLPRSAFGTLGGGEPDRWGKWLTVGLIQSLVQSPQRVARWLPRVGTVIVDECHHLPAETYSRVVSQFPAFFRCGLTATPHREDGLGPMATAILGARVDLPLETLVAAQRVVLPRIVGVPTGWRYRGLDRHWPAMEAARAADGPRNQLVVQCAVGRFRAGHPTVILVERTRHAAHLARTLQRIGIAATAVIGETRSPDRQRAFAAINAGQTIGVATQLLNEGVDLPRLDTLIIGAAGKSQTRVFQQLGRTFRTTLGKTGAVVYDLMDTATPTYARQVERRLAFYRDLGVQILLSRSPDRKEQIE